MFARLFAVASLAVLAIAGPASLVARDECNSGSLNCCNSVQQANSVNNLFNEVGLVNILAGVTGQVAFGCSPISAVGLGSQSCTQQTVCCTGNKFNGLIQTGCTPINVGA